VKTQTKDYYRLLGVRPDATVLLIKKAYRKLAKQYHPDVNDSPDAAERFREITEAYDTLTDSDRRRRYDRLHGFGRTTSGTDDGSSRYYRTGDSTRTSNGSAHGNSSPMASRIIKVGNAYDDLVGDSADRDRALAVLERLRLDSVSEYDPAVVEALSRVIDRGYPR